MAEEVDLIQEYTLWVLSNRSIIETIWAEIDDLSCDIKNVSKAIISPEKQKVKGKAVSLIDNILGLLVVVI